jgi:cell division septum initiation protein DivIVA
MLQKPQPDQADTDNQSSPNDGDDLDIQRALDRLEEKIIDNPRIPFIRRTLIDEDEILAQVDFIRVSLPVAIQRAEDLIATQQAIIQQAENQAAEVRAIAQQKADQMIAQTEIVRQAEAEANQIRRQLENDCRKMRQQTISELEQMQQTAYQELEQLRQITLAECDEIQAGADDYADQVLNNLENQLQNMLEIIQNGRRQLE